MTATRQARSGRFGLGAALCVLSAIAFGTIGVFGKTAYDEGLEVPDLLATRFAIAAAVLWVIVAFLPSEHRPSPRGTLTGVVLGGFVYAAMAAAYFMSLRRIDASLTILLVQISPALVAIGAVALGRERLSRTVLVALPVALAGTALIAVGAFDGAGALNAAGIVLALACAVLYAAYILLSHALVAGTHPVVLAAQVSTGCAVAFGVAALVTGRVPHTGPRGWLIILAMALVATVAGLVLLAAATAIVGPSTAALLSTMEPVTATALAVVLLGERLTALQWLGAVLVIGSVVLITLGGRAGTPRRPGRNAWTEEDRSTRDGPGEAW